MDQGRSQVAAGGWRRDRGPEVCSNALRLARTELEARVLGACRERILTPEGLLYAVDRAVAIVRERRRGLDPSAVKARLEEIERELSNLRRFAAKTGSVDEAADLFDSHHMAGTVLAYANHRPSQEFYAAPGEQDLTAHVNFTALRQWGERTGLERLGLVSQTAFLLALGKANDFADLYDDGMHEAERVRARLQLKTLIFPEGMGERFQVLIQQKGVPNARLAGLAGL